MEGEIDPSLGSHHTKSNVRVNLIRLPEEVLVRIIGMTCTRTSMMLRQTNRRWQEAVHVKHVTAIDHNPEFVTLDSHKNYIGASRAPMRVTVPLRFANGMLRELLITGRNGTSGNPYSALVTPGLPFDFTLSTTRLSECGESALWEDRSRTHPYARQEGRQLRFITFQRLTKELTRDGLACEFALRSYDNYRWWECCEEWRDRLCHYEKYCSRCGAKYCYIPNIPRTE